MGLPKMRRRLLGHANRTYFALLMVPGLLMLTVLCGLCSCTANSSCSILRCQLRKKREAPLLDKQCQSEA